MTDHNDTGATARPWREALRREPERYAACSPEAISHGSQAQMKYFVADAQHDIAILATRLAEVERERDEARSKLFPYADAKEISGMSWSGFCLIGDTKSVAELRRLENRSSQLEVFRAEYDRRVNAAEARAIDAEDRVAVLEKALHLVWDAIPGFEPLGSSLETRVDAQHWWEVVAPAVRTALAAEQKEAGRD